MNKNQIIVILLIVIVVGAAGAYILLTPTVPTGVTYVRETIGNPDYLDPATNYESYGSGVMENVYEGLMGWEYMSMSTTPKTLLAESYTVSSDGLEYTFVLQEGVTFHDGTPFNASCVKYSIERILAIAYLSGPGWMLWDYLKGGADVVYGHDPGSDNHEGNYTAWVAANDAGTGAITVVDTYTVKLTLEAPYAPFIAILAGPWGSIVSPSYVEAHGGVVIGEHNTHMEENTCGTGPYMVTSWVVDEQITLERNTNYWREAEAKAEFPYAGTIDKIISKTNEDVQSRNLNFLGDEAHEIYVPTTHATEFYNFLDPPDFATYDGLAQSKDPSAYKIWAAYPQFTIAEIHFTMSEYMNETTLNRVVENPYHLKNVRKAWCYAFNYTAEIYDINNGIAVQGKGPVPIGMFGHYEEDYPYTYDLETAQEYWNAAMEDDDLDSILANNSYRLIFYHNSGNEVRRKSQLLLKDGLTAMLAMEDTIQPSEDLTIDVQGIEWSTYIHAAIDGTVGCWMIGWIPDYPDPDNYVIPYCRTDGTYSGWARIDETPEWNGAQVDGWISDAAESTDEAERLTLYQNIQEAIVEHAAYIWCYQYATCFVVSREVYNAQSSCNPMRAMPYFYHVYLTA